MYYLPWAEYSPYSSLRTLHYITAAAGEKLRRRPGPPHVTQHEFMSLLSCHLVVHGVRLNTY